MANDDLPVRVYEELRALAQAKLLQERPGHTLQATALVHEAFVRLSAQNRAGTQSKSQFMAIAAETMRRVLVDHARARLTEKRGGDRRRVTLSDSIADDSSPAVDVLELDEVLDELARVDERAARVVTLRFFGGLDVAATADLLGVSDRTIKSEWRFARAWLQDRLKSHQSLPLDSAGHA